MKDTFWASFIHNGILGGGLFLRSDKVVYRTNKLTVDVKYRNLGIEYSDILAIDTGRFLFFPTVTFKLQQDMEYKFIVFRRKKFLKRIEELKTTNKTSSI